MESEFISGSTKTELGSPDMDHKHYLLNYGTRRIAGNIEWAMRLDQSKTGDYWGTYKPYGTYCPELWIWIRNFPAWSDPDLLPWMTWNIGSGYGQIWKCGTSRPDRIRNDLKARIRIRNKLFWAHKTAPDAEKLLAYYLRWAWKKYQASLSKDSKNCKGKIVSKAGLKPFELLQQFLLSNFQKTRGKISRVWFGALPDNDLLTAGAEQRVCGAAAPQPVRRGMKPKQRILCFNPSSLIIKGGAMVYRQLDRSSILVVTC